MAIIPESVQKIVQQQYMTNPQFAHAGGTSYIAAYKPHPNEAVNANLLEHATNSQVELAGYSAAQKYGPQYGEAFLKGYHNALNSRNAPDGSLVTPQDAPLSGHGLSVNKTAQPTTGKAQFSL